METERRPGRSCTPDFPEPLLEPPGLPQVDRWPKSGAQGRGHGNPNPSTVYLRISGRGSLKNSDCGLSISRADCACSRTGWAEATLGYRSMRTGGRGRGQIEGRDGRGDRCIFFLEIESAQPSARYIPPRRLQVLNAAASTAKSSSSRASSWADVIGGARRAGGWRDRCSTHPPSTAWLIGTQHPCRLPHPSATSSRYARWRRRGLRRSSGSRRTVVTPSPALDAGLVPSERWCGHRDGQSRGSVRPRVWVGGAGAARGPLVSEGGAGWAWRPRAGGGQRAGDVRWSEQSTKRMVARFYQTTAEKSINAVWWP
jgi:hypothetical protein